MTQQFFTAPTFPNPYIAYEINNIDLIPKKEQLDKEVLLYYSKIGKNSGYTTTSSKPG